MGRVRPKDGKDLLRSHVAELDPEPDSVSPAIKWVRLGGMGSLANVLSQASSGAPCRKSFLLLPGGLSFSQAVGSPPLPWTLSLCFAISCVSVPLLLNRKEGWVLLALADLVSRPELITFS